MGALTPSPAEVRARFDRLYRGQGPEAATEDFYQLCRAADYIRVDRIAKNARFFEDTPCGKLEITINLSKPEKDPRDIAAQRGRKANGLPQVHALPENPGYAGRIGFPARQNHRIIPLTLGGKSWYMQYSPYLYYNEHCIVFNAEHVPMRISRDTFVRLCDFVDQFPHYMRGSNADLPIVGGSILSHDHFQGGNYHFPMDGRGRPHRAGVAGSRRRGARRRLADDLPRADQRRPRRADRPVRPRARRVARPFRSGLRHPRRDRRPAQHDHAHPCAAKTDGTGCSSCCATTEPAPNTAGHLSPARRFAPHQKENIGLIEVMGLFILPGRLLTELKGLESYLTGETPLDRQPGEGDPLVKHYGWVCEIAAQTGTNLTQSEGKRGPAPCAGGKVRPRARRRRRLQADTRRRRRTDALLETVGFAKMGLTVPPGIPRPGLSANRSFSMHSRRQSPALDCTERCLPRSFCAPSRRQKLHLKWTNRAARASHSRRRLDRFPCWRPSAHVSRRSAPLPHLRYSFPARSL